MTTEGKMGFAGTLVELGRLLGYQVVSVEVRLDLDAEPKDMPRWLASLQRRSNLGVGPAAVPIIELQFGVGKTPDEALANFHAQLLLDTNEERRRRTESADQFARRLAELET